MYKTVVVGSGLSSYFFLKGLNTINDETLLIDYEIDCNEKSDLKNNLSYKNLPPRINERNIGSVNSFFKKNNFQIDNNCSVTGLLKRGGVSNLWGFSCEFPRKENINFLNNQNAKQITIAFEEIYKNYRFEGITEYECNFYNEKKIDNNLERLLDINNKNIKFFKNCSAINSIKCTKNNDNCWINCKNSSTFIPDNLEKIHINRKNLFLKKIKYNTQYYSLICEDNKKQEIIIKTKKLILACGTLATTRLIMEMINHEDEVKILHNPMIFGCFILKRPIRNNYYHWLSQLGSTNIFGEIKSRTNYRSSNYIIKEMIIKKNFLFNNFIIKKLYNFFENKMLFVNLYLDNDFSNLYFKNQNNKNIIYTDSKMINKTKRILYRNLNNVYKLLKKKNIIHPFKFSQIPKMGHDNHYIGTIPINGKGNKMYVNENCELNSFKNLFIVDGSVIPKNSTFFPTGLIMSNAYRIGKNFENF